MAKPLFSFLLLAVAAGALIGALAFMRPGQKSETQEPVPLLAADKTPSVSNTTTVLAPNGKMTLTMNEKKEGSSVSYTFTVSDNESGEKKEILTKTLPEGASLEIPDNTFSPDNKYLFLKEKTAVSVNYYVVSTVDTKVFNVSDLFKEKLAANFVITDVTGWGGMTLLIVNTDKVEGGIGPTFWFEPPASFIRLSTRFHS